MSQPYLGTKLICELMFQLFIYLIWSGVVILQHIQTDKYSHNQTKS